MDKLLKYDSPGAIEKRYESGKTAFVPFFELIPPFLKVGEVG